MLTTFNNIQFGRGAYGDKSQATGQQLGSYSGDGRYIINGDKLALFPSAGTPEALLIRLVSDYEASTPSKKKDHVSPYELCPSRLANYFPVQK